MKTTATFAAALALATCLAGCSLWDTERIYEGDDDAEYRRQNSAGRRVDDQDRLRVNPPWMVSLSEAEAALERERLRYWGEPEDLDGLRGLDSRVVWLKETFLCFYRDFTIPSEIEWLDLHESLVGRPGPKPAGTFEANFLHWMDFERARHASPWVDYRARLFPDSGVSGQSDDMGFVQQDFTGRWQDEAFGPVLRVRRLGFFDRPVLPDTGERFPSRLTDVQAGISFPWILPPGLWNVTIGSASDRLFDSNDEVTADITWTYGSNLETDGLVFYLNYSNNRDWLNRRLIPGVAYRYKQGNWFTLVAGFPDSAVAHRPCGQVELAASYRFPRTVAAEVAYTPRPDVRIHAGFDWSNQRYFRHDRQDTEDRLWYDEKRVSLGVRWDITRHVFLDVSGGYAFDRMWFEGETYEDRSFNRINVSDGPFAGVQLGIRF